MTPPRRRPEARWRSGLRGLLDAPLVGVSVILLILASVALTIIEFAIDPRSVLHAELTAANHVITVLFAAELSLRWLAMRRRRWFWREYWLDLLALVPAFRVFRLFRAVRLLRLLRLFRVSRLMSRATGGLPYLLRRASAEYSLLACFLVFCIIFGASAMLMAEQRANPALTSFEHTFWWSIFTLLSGESTTTFPSTTEGRLIAVTVIFLGMGVFALVTGTVSAVMVERLTKLEDPPMELLDLEEHVLICGYSRKAALILEELEAADGHEQSIVLIADAAHEAEVRELRRRFERLHLVTGDFTRADVLERAGAPVCGTCIILSDRSGNRSEQDADARTLLAALTIEKLNADVFTCAELNNADYVAHLEGGGVDDVVIGGEHSAMLLAQAALNRGLGEVVSELLSARKGSHFYKVDIPPRLVGASFVELLNELKTQHDAIPIGYEDVEGEQVLNPSSYQARAGDKLIVIAHQRTELR